MDDEFKKHCFENRLKFNNKIDYLYHQALFVENALKIKLDKINERQNQEIINYLATFFNEEHK